MGTPSLAGCPALSIISIYTGSSSTADGTADPRGGAPPYTWGGSRFRLAPGYEPGLQRARCAHSWQAPPGSGRAYSGACQHPGGPLLSHGAAVLVCGPA